MYAAAEPGEVLRAWRAAWPLLLMVPLFAALGMLQSNTAWWPGGDDDASWWLWPLLLAAALVATAVVCVRLPIPPVWAWRLALGAFALHCLVDFNLQSPGICGTLIVVAVLAGGPAHHLGTCTISRGMATVLTIGAMAGLLFGSVRASQIAGGERTLRQLVAIDKRPLAQPPSAQHRYASAAARDDVRRIAEAWPESYGLAFRLVLLTPAGSDRLPDSTALAARHPWSGPAQELLAQDCAATGRWDEAVAAMSAAVERAPADLARRQRLAGLLERAAVASPLHATALRRRADEERARIAALEPLVHPRNRP
jgi:hypothetical protein